MGVISHKVPFQVSHSFLRAGSPNTSPEYFLRSPYGSFLRHFGIHVR